MTSRCQTFRGLAASPQTPFQASQLYQINETIVTALSFTPCNDKVKLRYFS